LISVSPLSLNSILQALTRKLNASGVLNPLFYADSILKLTKIHLKNNAFVDNDNVPYVLDELKYAF